MTRRGWALFAMLCLVWGVPYLLIKVAVEGVSPPVIVFVRCAIGALVLIPLPVRAGGWSAIRRHWRPLLAFSALEVLGPWWLLADAERHLSSSMTGLLIAAVPIVGVVAARLTGGTEKLGAVRWGGLFVGLAGVAVLAAPHLAGGGTWPVIEVLLVVLGYATAPLIVARKLRDVPSQPLIAACLAIGALVYAPPAFASWPQQMPSVQVLLALAGLAVICTALAFLIFFALIHEVGPSRAMVFTYVNPAVAVSAGVVVLGEPLTPTILMAFALILAGCFLATWSPRRSAVATNTDGDVNLLRDSAH